MPPAPVEGLQPVEILHIDTEGSQEFFARLEINPSEKCDCEKLALDLFSECCQQFDGYIASWQGDGGHAYFPANLKSGNSVQAAKMFISKLPVLAQQTATTLSRRATPDSARRKFRIKAHFGLVRLSENAGLDAGFSEVLDAVIKNEKELAPTPDELFITEQLRAQLGRAEKEMFEPYLGERLFGTLKTTLYRLQCKPTNHGRSVFESDRRPEDISDSEWQYLRSHILSQRMNVAARNSITTSLIAAVSDPKNRGRIDNTVVMNVTIRALYNYMRAAYPHYAFRVAVWRPQVRGEVKLIEKITEYPFSGLRAERRVRLGDLRYQVVRAFNSCSPIVTQSVSEARLRGDWVDFDASQEERTRGLHSALQLPIYRVTSRVGEYVEKQALAVLSVDSDKPDFFLKEELDLWTDEFVGYLANLSLAEVLYLADPARGVRSETQTAETKDPVELLLVKTSPKA